MRLGWLCVLAGCGRVSFGAQGDAASPDASNVLIDFSGAVPFDPNDFDDTGSVDNGTRALAALYPPYADGFVVAAGRAMIELRLDGTIVVHDYRPAAPDTSGPDQIVGIVCGTLAAEGPRIWLTSTSTQGGDGLYYLDPGWQITRENTLNNSAGVGIDPGGGFDGRAVPTLYFAKGNGGVLRRDDSATQTTIWASGNDVGSVATTTNALYVVDEPNPQNLIRVASGSHTGTQIDSAMRIALAEGGDDAAVYAIRDFHDLVSYAPDGSHTVLASTTDPDTSWVTVSLPRAPHPLAGRFVVLEQNRTLLRDRLIVLP